LVCSFCLLVYHGYGIFGAFIGANAATLAIIQMDDNLIFLFTDAPGWAIKFAPAAIIAFA
jgi:hypothetical protein